MIDFSMILVGDEQTLLTNQTHSPLSLALGIIGGYLEKNNITFEIYDINAEFKNYLFSDEDRKKWSVIFDSERVIKYLDGFEDYQLDEFAKEFLSNLNYEAKAFGISIGADFSLFQIHQGLVLGKYLKKTMNKPVFIGGNNIDYMLIYEEFYNSLLKPAVENLDYIIRGPGEKTIYKIITGEYKDKEMIPGILRIEENRVISNKEESPIVIKPSWGDIDISDYVYPLDNNQKENEKLLYSLPSQVSNEIFKHIVAETKSKAAFIPYIFNYNCNYCCAFCTQSAEERGDLIIGDVKKVVDNLEDLSKTFNTKYFYFLNNYFPSSNNFINSFHKEIKSRKLEIYWSDCGRVNGMTKEKLEKLYDAGCRKLVFGFETGDENMLKFIDKRLSLEELSRVLKWCKEVGIWADVEIIVGLPYEDMESFNKTYDFVKSHLKYINNFWMNEFFLIPNSLIGTYPERYGIKIKPNLFTYKRLSDYNKKEFLGDKQAEMTSNSRLWGFDEINEGQMKSFKEIQKENSKKMNKLETLRNPEFKQLYRFYSMLTDLRKLGSVS